MSTIAERVEAGAKWLDANRPGWVDRINLETLDLGDPCRCVLGQEFGEYYLRPYSLRKTPTTEVDHGFEAGYVLTEDYDENFDYAEILADYAEMTQAWRDYITARRAA